MVRRENGFTLVELMVTMLIFVIVIVVASNIFSGLLNQFKQQSKIVETNIEGLAGLQIMRTDVEQAGYGLPWNVEHTDPEDGTDDWPSLANYNEAVAAAALPAPYAAVPGLYNDGAPASALPAPQARRAPRAILGGKNLGLFAVDPADNTRSSDYLVVKATSVGVSDAAQQWTYIANTGGSNYSIRSTGTDPWVVGGSARDDLATGTRVIAVRPTMGTGGASMRVLYADDVNTLFTTYSTAANWASTTNFRPYEDSFQTNIIYGVDPNTNLRMPFNRADYYVRTPGGMPSRCAPNTGVLYKATVNQGTGTLTEFPLLDCVADMQVVFLSATTAAPNTILWNNADWTDGLSAQEIRDQIRTAYIYILAHEGQRDPSFTFTNTSGACSSGNCIRVGDENPAGTLWGRNFDLQGIIGADWANYRWKVYTIAVPLYNLR